MAKLNNLGHEIGKQRKFTILHLDTSKIFRDALRDVLHGIPGLTVLSADSVHNAINELAKSNVDMVVADRLGLLIADKMREISPNLPIIILSALPIAEAVESKEIIPVTTWIEKGFDWPNRLASMIELHVTALPKLFENSLILNCTIVNFGEKQEEGQLIKAVSLPWFAILREIERNDKYVLQFARYPRKFEEFIAGAYERSGWRDVIVTPQSRDRGRDIIISATLPGVGRIQIVDELKAYSIDHTVTAKDVSRLAWVLQRDSEVSKGIVTTTSKFAPSVYDEFKGLLGGRLELKDGKQLRDWLLSIGKCQKVLSQW